MKRPAGRGGARPCAPAALRGHGGAGRAMGKRDGAAFSPPAAADATLLARGIRRRARPIRSAARKGFARVIKRLRSFVTASIAGRPKSDNICRGGVQMRAQCGARARGGKIFSPRLPAARLCVKIVSSMYLCNGGRAHDLPAYIVRQLSRLYHAGHLQQPAAASVRHLQRALRRDAGAAGAAGVDQLLHPDRGGSARRPLCGSHRPPPRGGAGAGFLHAGAVAAGRFALSAAKRLCRHPHPDRHERGGRRASGGAGQPHRRIAPRRAQGKGHEPFALVLLLGARGGGAALHRLLRPRRGGQLALSAVFVGRPAASERLFVRQSADARRRWPRTSARRFGPCSPAGSSGCFC